MSMSLASRASLHSAPDRSYTPPIASAAELGDMLRTLHIVRVVVVAPSVYGSDNAATVDAVRKLGQARARGVAWLPEDRSDNNLRALKIAGIAGFRCGQAALSAELRTRFDIAARWGWHLDIATPPDIIGGCLTQLMASPVPLVLDTFAWIDGGMGQQGADAVLSLIRAGVAYVKLSEPYRLFNHAPDYPKLKPLVATFIAANPDRILWGSGWPYVSGSVPGRPITEITPNLPIETSDLLSVFASWVPDDAMRRKILVDNPARLYGFGGA